MILKFQIFLFKALLSWTLMGPYSALLAIHVPSDSIMIAQKKKHKIAQVLSRRVERFIKSKLPDQDIVSDVHIDFDEPAYSHYQKRIQRLQLKPLQQRYQYFWQQRKKTTSGRKQKILTVQLDNIQKMLARIQTEVATKKSRDFVLFAIVNVTLSKHLAPRRVRNLRKALEKILRLRPMTTEIQIMLPPPPVIVRKIPELAQTPTLYGNWRQRLTGFWSRIDAWQTASALRIKEHTKRLQMQLVTKSKTVLTAIAISGILTFFIVLWGLAKDRSQTTFITTEPTRYKRQFPPPLTTRKHQRSHDRPAAPRRLHLKPLLPHTCFSETTFLTAVTTLRQSFPQTYSAKLNSPPIHAKQPAFKQITQVPKNFAQLMRYDRATLTNLLERIPVSKRAELIFISDPKLAQHLLNCYQGKGKQSKRLYFELASIQHNPQRQKNIVAEQAHIKETIMNLWGHPADAASSNSN